jgi:hypothetical protein
VKLAFLFIWTLFHTDPFDWEYLQFPDEFRYAVIFKLGDDIVGNLYDIFTYYLREIGFSIVNLKMVNILITSFAITRLYSLACIVRNKRIYTIYLISFGGVLFVHIIYYSIFVLKDSIIFYFSIELLIQLIHRRRKNNWIQICLIILILVAFRKQMVLLGTVFMFNKNWQFKWKRLIIAVPLSIVALDLYGMKFYDYIAGGMIYSLHMDETRTEIKDFARTGVINYPGLYLSLIAENIKRSISIIHQSDTTNRIILLLEWCTVMYLLLVNQGFKKIIPYWPILTSAAIYFTVGIMTLYNIRYNIFPMIFFLYTLILISSEIIEGYVISTNRKIEPRILTL